MGIIINAPRPTGLAPNSAWETYRDLDVSTPAYVGAAADAWVGGVTFRSEGCLSPDTFPTGDICTPTPREIDMDDAQDLEEADTDDLTFTSFEINGVVRCPVVGGKSDEWLRSWVEDQTRQYRSARLAAQVERGTYTTSGTLNLADSADDVSTTDLTPVGALANIEDALAQRIGSATGMIHLTPGLATRLRGALVFEPGGARTVSGHLVVIDGGYVGASPSTGAAVAGEQWIYGSGEVFYKATGFRYLGTTSELFDRERNVQYAVGQQFAVAAFEPCTVVAAKVDITP
jgi:hypothetical protein